MIERYLFGKRQLEEHLEVHVIEAPHSLKGTDFLYENPKLRADDLILSLIHILLAVHHAAAKVQ